MIDLKTIRELAKLMAANELSELHLEDENDRLTLKRGWAEAGVRYPAAGPGVAHVTPLAPTAVPGAAAPVTPPTAEPVGELHPIASPMVGTCYLAPAPDAKPFIAVGDTVEPEKVVCIIEAMKVFNEIKAETTGRIEKILVRNGQAVEFGQALFLVKPA